MKIVTLKELGTKLPVGQFADGQLHKDFTLRPFKARVDRHLAVWREANEGKNQVHLAAKYLSLIVASLGRTACGLTPDGDSTPEQEYAVGDWFFADAMYIYIYSRVVNVSEWIEVPYRCPRCGTKGVVKANLLSTEVRVLEDHKELHVWVDLQDGFKVADGARPVKRLRLQPVRFRAMMLPGQGQAEIGTLTYSQLRESIVEMEGAPQGHIPTDAELDELTKRDLLRIDRQTAAIAAGPMLRTAVDCPKTKECGIKIHDALNWAFDPFFDTSVPLSALS